MRVEEVRIRTRKKSAKRLLVESFWVEFKGLNWYGIGTLLERIDSKMKGAATARPAETDSRVLLQFY